MNFLFIFLQTFFSNLSSIILIFLFFLLTSLTGVFILIYLVKEKDYKILLPAGILTGIFGFISCLALFSYFLKGRTGISIIFLFFIMLSFLLWRKTSKIRSGFRIVWTKHTILAGIISFAIIFLLLLTAGNNIYGGDTVAYWGLATSFANGNYPVRSPWQPDLLANHHQGAFLYEGAVFALTGVDMRLIHSLFAFLVIAAGFFLCWGWFGKLTNSRLLSILPSLVIYFSFGAIFIPLPMALSGYLYPETTRTISQLPTLADAKPRLGGAANLNDLFYINHRAAALGGLVLLLILLVSEFRIKSYWKFIIIAVLISAIISADEITLPAIGLSVASWFICSLVQMKEGGRRVLLKNIAIFLLILLIMFFAVGSALRDSLLTSSTGETRFLLLFSTKSILDRMESLKGVILVIKDSSWMLFLPDLRMYFISGLLIVFLMHDLFAGLILATGIGTIIAYFLSEHTYYPGNEARFLDFLYPIFGLLISYFVLKLAVKQKKKIFHLIIFWFSLLMLLPAIAFAIFYLSGRAQSNLYPNLNGEVLNYPTLKWIQKTLPDKRIFFIDGFLKEELYSELTLYGIQNYGLIIPIGPAFFRVHTPNWGPEAIDIIHTLNPLPLKQLKIDYVFITYNQIKLFPKQRQDDLNNPNFFIKSYDDYLGILYKIRDMYFTDGKNMSGTISELSGLIDGDKNIYLDSPPRLNFYFWTTIMLSLKDKGRIYTVRTREGFDYIETKINFSEPKANQRYDYLILDSATDPLKICHCSEVEEIWHVNRVIAYKVR